MYFTCKLLSVKLNQANRRTPADFSQVICSKENKLCHHISVSVPGVVSHSAVARGKSHHRFSRNVFMSVFFLLLREINTS